MHRGSTNLKICFLFFSNYHFPICSTVIINHITLLITSLILINNLLFFHFHKKKFIFHSISAPMIVYKMGRVLVKVSS